MDQMKKQYVKPALKSHGSVEALTGFGPAGHDVFGGGFLSTNAKCKSTGHGPADKAS